MTADSSNPDRAISTTTTNAQRSLVALIRQAAREHNIRVESLGDDWILRLSWPDGSTRSIHGYAFDLNRAASHLIACDKAATSAVLASAGVACVPHRLVLHPEMSQFVPMPYGSLRPLLDEFERLKQDVVLKDNTGTGGRHVWRCTTPVELEQAALHLFARRDTLAICPYVPISREVRVVLLHDQPQVVYEKVRAHVEGDGASSIADLAARNGLANLLQHLPSDELRRCSRVPARGERVPINWRHNLGQGATARLLDAGREHEAIALAQRAARALHLAFGSVDVISSEHEPTPHVLEVNSGVMLEFLARTLTEGERIAREVYARALSALSRDVAATANRA